MNKGLHNSLSSTSSDGGSSSQQILDSNSGKRSLAAFLSFTLIGTILFSAVSGEPQPANATGRDLGIITVDCDSSDDGYLQPETIRYMEIGDTFIISNAEYEACEILATDILAGEDADHSGLGPGILEKDEDSDVITISGSGTFYIVENSGEGRSVPFTVVQSSFFFINPDGDPIGELAELGDTYSYEDVTVFEGASVDAFITVDEVSNVYDRGTFNPDTEVYENPTQDVFELDHDGVGIETRLRSKDGEVGYVEYTINFHADEDPSTPVTVTDIYFTVQDIDEYQYVEVQNVDDYFLSSDPQTKLTATTTGTATRVAELGFLESEFDDEDFWASFYIASASSITIRLGNDDEGSSAHFGINFEQALWSNAPSVDGVAPNDPAELPATGLSSASLPPVLALTFMLSTLGAWLVSRSRREKIQP